MKSLKILMSLFLFSAVVGALEPGDSLVIKVPVADLSSGYSVANNEGVAREKGAVHRLHQGLCNEVVTFVQAQGNYYKILYTNVMYGQDKQKQPLRMFGIHKNSVTPVKDLSPDELAAIPHRNKSLVTLVYPTEGLSVGTQLVRAPEFDTADMNAVHWCDFDSHVCDIAHIPVENVWKNQILSPDQQRQAFVGMLRELVDRVAKTHKVIPYVWGGSSFVTGNKQDDFSLRNGVWQRPKDSSGVYTGYDCSDLVMRFAQMVGIQFPWRNSSTIKEHCKALQKGQDVEDGDLIWIPGHIMIISDVKNSEIIQARGYSSGYGYVDKGHISKTFAGINSIQDLVERYFSTRSVAYVKADGTAKSATTFSLLKLM